jgi:hypothetical protein
MTYYNHKKIIKLITMNNFLFIVLMPINNDKTVGMRVGVGVGGCVHVGVCVHGVQASMTTKNHMFLQAKKNHMFLQALFDKSL